MTKCNRKSMELQSDVLCHQTLSVARATRKNCASISLDVCCQEHLSNALQQGSDGVSGGERYMRMMLRIGYV